MEIVCVNALGWIYLFFLFIFGTYVIVFAEEAGLHSCSAQCRNAIFKIQALHIISIFTCLLIL